MVSISLRASGDATFAILYVFCGGNDHTSTDDGVTILYVLGTILVTASGDAIVSILFVLVGGYSTASGDAIVRQRHSLMLWLVFGMLVEGSHEPINHEGVTTLQNFLAMCLEYNVMW